VRAGAVSPAAPRVLHLVLQLSLGGAETMVALLVRHLDPARWSAEAWALDTGGAIERRLVDAGVPTRVLHKGRGFRPAFLRELRALLARERFDIVHAHNAPAARWALVATAGLRPRPIRVRTEHTFNAPKRWGYALGHAVSGAGFDAVIGVSRDTTERHRRLDPLWRRRYLTIPNGIDLASARAATEPDLGLRDRLGLPRGAPLLANLGNLRQPKGQTFLLEAFRGLSTAYPRAHLVVFGEGPLRGRLEGYCAEHGLTERVHLVGHRDDAALLLAAADLVVQSSVREGMPVSLLEAGCVSRPIVATDVGGTRELVRDGETGLLVRAGDADALERAMRRMLDERDAAERMARAMHGLVVTEHDIRVVARATGELYAKLLARRPG